MRNRFLITVAVGIVAGVLAVLAAAGPQKLGCCTRAEMYEYAIRRAVVLIDEGRCAEAQRVLRDVAPED